MSAVSATFIIYGCPKAIILLNIHFEQYISKVRMIQKLLRDAEEAVDIVNKEEVFYQWDLTSYPEVEAIKEHIEPYHKLFAFILKWQNTESRSEISP